MARVIVSMAMSLFIAGLGIAYEGDLELGVGLVLLWVMLCLVALYSAGAVSVITGAMALVVWIYSLFKTFIISVEN